MFSKILIPCDFSIVNKFFIDMMDLEDRAAQMLRNITSEEVQGLDKDAIKAFLAPPLDANWELSPKEVRSE